MVLSLTRSLLLILCLLISGTPNAYSEGPYDHENFGSGMVNWFHQRIHEDGRPELYLVCNYEFKVQSHGIQLQADRGYEELVISCTIVDVIRGPKKIGEKFEYRRYLEGKAKDLVDLEKMRGELQYVFFVEAPGGHRFVDPQDPFSTMIYNEETRKAANFHKDAHLKESQE